MCMLLSPTNHQLIAIENFIYIYKSYLPIIFYYIAKNTYHSNILIVGIGSRAPLSPWLAAGMYLDISVLKGSDQPNRESQRFPWVSSCHVVYGQAMYCVDVHRDPYQ